MADRMIWVENGRYNAAREKEREANRRRQAADRKVKAERENRRRVEQEARRVQQQDASMVRQRLQEETNRILAGIDEATEGMRQDLEAHVERTNRELDRIRTGLDRVQQQADTLEGKTDALAADVERTLRTLAEHLEGEQNRAQLYVNRFAYILERIEALHPEKLTPGVKEQELDPVTAFLQVNMRNGDYQAAIGLAQTKIPEALALQIRLEELNSRFALLRTEAKDLMEELAGRIRCLSSAKDNVRQVTVEQTDCEYDGRIDFWSDGLFSDFSQSFSQLCARYAQAEEAMDLDAMTAAIGQLEQAALQLTECEELALWEFSLSCMTELMALRIHEALTCDASWQMRSSGFAGDDGRRAYHMVYADGDGNVASFVLLPCCEVTERGEYGQLQFLVDVSDGAKAPDRCRSEVLRNGILARLADHGIGIGYSHKKPLHAVGNTGEHFIAEATEQADRIKQERLEPLRRQLTGGSSL